ncbi:MAG: rod shape-determining protein MreD [Actinomycetota bacterium]
MRRFVLCVAVVAIALLLQLTLVDRLPLGGGAPDLVLLATVVLALSGGPAAGMLTGFWAGLALDIAPPASQLVGERAFVFCLVGYGCGQLRGLADRSALVSSMGLAAVAAAAGEVLYAVTGLILGSPGVTWAAIRFVLPSSALMDIIISPFVVYLVHRAVTAPQRDRIGGPAVAGLLALRPSSLPASRSSAPALLGGVKPPRLRRGTGQAGSAAGGRPPRPMPSRPVRIRAGSLKRTGTALRPPGSRLRSPGAPLRRGGMGVPPHPRLHGFWRAGSGRGGGF